METLVVFYIIICFALAVYCGKRAVEKGYSKNYGQALGLFLGILGWIIIELMADKRETEAKNKHDNADALLKYKQLYDAGVITQTEFEQKKRELL